MLNSSCSSTLHIDCNRLTYATGHWLLSNPTLRLLDPTVEATCRNLSYFTWQLTAASYAAGHTLHLLFLCHRHPSPHRHPGHPVKRRRQLRRLHCHRIAKGCKSRLPLDTSVHGACVLVGVTRRPELLILCLLTGSSVGASDHIVNVESAFAIHPNSNVVTPAIRKMLEIGDCAITRFGTRRASVLVRVRMSPC
jgi:hypothetical protein